jgi:hypothetical protein
MRGACCGRERTVTSREAIRPARWLLQQASLRLASSLTYYAVQNRLFTQVESRLGSGAADGVASPYGQPRGPGSHATAVENTSPPPASRHHPRIARRV